MGLRQNALILLLLTALIGIASDWSGHAQLARLWCAPAGLLLLGLAYERWIVGRAGPTLLLRAPEQWYLGRATAVRFAVVHRLARTLSFELAPSAVPEVSIDRSVRVLVAAGEISDGDTLYATARRLGRYQWPNFRARIGGVLGLAWWPRTLAAGGEFRVVPDILHTAERAAGANTRGAVAAQRSGSGGEILQLREYRPGDPQRSIDWKASARARRLISRDFAEDQQLDIIVAVNSGRASGLAAGDTDRLALYANVAARLAQRAASLDDRIGLLVYAERPLAALAPGHGVSAVMRVRALLSEMSVQRADSNHALAAIRIRSLVRHRSLVILLTDLDDLTIAGEMRGAIRLLLPKHLPLVAAVSSERVGALAQGTASDEQEAYRVLAAQEYHNAQLRNAASLQALGAPAVLAAPYELDHAVLHAYENFRRRRRI
jgi:uncharacterized protein (DUF58 family)